MIDPLSLSALSFAAFTTALGGALSWHFVPEGHVAIFYRHGALLNRTAGPGFSASVPFMTRVEFVQTTVQTDRVERIPCGTKGGTVIHFGSIEVVNQLEADAVLDTVRRYTVNYDKTWIYDKIHHEINQICSRSTLEEMYITKFDALDETLQAALQRDIDKFVPGLSIIAIRVTKPTIPEAIRKNYEAVEAERTRLKVTEERQKVVQREAETEKARMLIEAETHAAVEAVGLELKMKQKRTEQELAAIANEMHASKAKADADADFYRVTREAEANKLLLTPELLQLESVRALSNNTKVFWGDSLPSIYADGAALVPVTGGASTGLQEGSSAAAY
jgi:regulator of protease activity HflC (stomatin/prohibitin superfamily)